MCHFGARSFVEGVAPYVRDRDFLLTSPPNLCFTSLSLSRPWYLTLLTPYTGPIYLDQVLAGYDDMLAKTRKWSLRIPILGRVSLDVFHFGRHWRWLNSVQYHMARSVFIRQHG